jgi:RimJ/RimL family protein N-acetyltransferase
VISGNFGYKKGITSHRVIIDHLRFNSSVGLLERRPVLFSDCNDLFQWRTDPQVAAFQLSGSEISYEEHIDWIASRLKQMSDFPFFAYELAGETVAFVRSDPYRTGISISILVSPHRRSKGLGTVALLDFLQFLTLRRSNREVYAVIHSNNFSSRKLFLGAGFHFVTTLDDNFQEFRWSLPENLPSHFIKSVY